MKKTIIVLLAMILLFSFAACDSKDPSKALIGTYELVGAKSDKAELTDSVNAMNKAISEASQPIEKLRFDKDGRGVQITLKSLSDLTYDYNYFDYEVVDNMLLLYYEESNKSEKHIYQYTLKGNKLTVSSDIVDGLQLLYKKK